MSFYEDASLVLVPSGYKTSKVYSAKPTDGAGDLVFTRTADTATRVGPDGLIEKVRTNVALYSEDLTNVIYAKTNATVTSNSETAPDGTLTADTITATSAFGQVQGAVVITSGIVYTMSVWLKRKTGTGQVSLRGVSNTSTAITITSDWVRYSVSLNAADTSGRYGVLLNTSGDEVYAWGFQLEASDVMTDYIGPTLGSAVSVGPVANVPRLDYLGSSCPRLLLEPQRTNLITFSEQFDDINWGKTDTTVTANTTISPDGYQNADTMTTTTSASRVFRSVSTGAGTFTISCYVKRLTGNDNFQFRLVVDGANQTQSFSVTDEWQRFTFTVTAASSVTSQQFRSSGAGTGTFAIWGAQFEQGAYATSYIPTLGAAVTRGADAASKTGISSLIGQTQGTLFVDFVVNGQQNNANILNGEKNTTQSFFMAVQTDGDFDAGLYIGGSLVGRIQWPAGITIGQRYKVAYAYKSGSFTLYINGVQSGILSNTFTPVATFDDIFLNDATTYFNYQENVSFNQALLFKTRLSNADLAALTA